LKLEHEGREDGGAEERDGGEERRARGGRGGGRDAVVGVALRGGGGLASVNVVLLRVADLPHAVLDVAVEAPALELTVQITI
jgi:hypothetical protein